MPKGPPPTWTSRDCRFDHVVTAVAGQGTGKPVSYQGIDTPDRAKDIKQGVYRCARHRGLSASVEWLHSGRLTSKSDDWPPDREPDGTYTLKITIYTKAQARKRHLARYGTDRSKWPYDPRRPKTQADIDAWAARGLDEKGHRKR
jgi:hypothetical protein